MAAKSTPGSSAVSSKVSKALEELVTKRKQQIAYLRRAHLADLDPKTGNPQTTTFWLNTIQLSQTDINKAVTDARKTRGWFCLGISLAKLLDQDSAPMLVNSFTQLMEEFSYQFGGRTIAGGFAYLRAKNLDQKSMSVGHSNVAAAEPIKPVIWKQNNKVVFEFLDTPNLPVGIDYCLTVHSLLSILYLIYEKFIDTSVSSEKWRKAIEMVDSKISTVILKPITSVLTRLTYNQVESQLITLLPASFTQYSNDAKVATDDNAKSDANDADGNSSVFQV